MGMTITDMIENSTLMDVNQTFRFGNNYILGGSGWNTGVGGTPSASSTPRVQQRLRESAKQVIYGHIRVLLLNEKYNDGESLGPVAGNPRAAHIDTGADQGAAVAIVSSSSKAPWVWWKPALHCLEAVLIVAAAYFLIVAVYSVIKFIFFRL